MPGYQRAWLVSDVVAGILVWSIVVPQAVAYAQIAGLPPSAGLVAAPGALLAYSWLGTSRALIVGATTATAALSATAVGPLADGDFARFAAFSAALAIVTAAVLMAAGLLGLGGVLDFVSKPVMTGFLFGLGLTVTIGQLPKLFGVAGSSGHFFSRLRDLVEHLDGTSWWTLGVGIASVAALVVFRRLAPALPGGLIVLVGGIVVSALLRLKSHGVAVVGNLPSALPDPELPNVGWHDLADLAPAALGMVLMSTEGFGVSRVLASAGGYRVDANRDLLALGGSNLLAGLSGGFVQFGGSSQTMAAERSGGKTQLLSLVAAGLVVLTGAFLAPLFEDLPQATLAAIVVVAIAALFRVDELRRYAALSRLALVNGLVALFGVLVFGILPGLFVAVILSLIELMKRLARPQLAQLVRDPETGAWGRADRHPEWPVAPGVLVLASEGPLFFANSSTIKDRIVASVDGTDRTPAAVVLDLMRNDDIDVGSLDMLNDLASALECRGVELRLANVHQPVLELLHRAGFARRVRIHPTLDAAGGSPARSKATTSSG